MIRLMKAAIGALVLQMALIAYLYVVPGSDPEASLWAMIGLIGLAVLTVQILAGILAVHLAWRAFRWLRPARSAAA